MDRKIVDLKRYLSKREVPRYAERNLAVNSAAQLHAPRESIKIDIILKSLETTSTKFKFPTTMNGYQRGINPVSALYENVQEILLKNNKNHEICRWVISLFSNVEWKKDLLTAIAADRGTLIEIYLHQEITSTDKETLEYMIEKFRYYTQVFSTI